MVWVNQQDEKLIGLQGGQSAKVVGVNPVQLENADFPIKENGGTDILLTDILSEIHKTEDEQDYLLDYKIIHYDEAILRAVERVDELKIEKVRNVTGEEIDDELEQLDTTVDRTNYMIGFGIGIPGGIAMVATMICFMWKCGLCQCADWCCRWCCAAAETAARQPDGAATGAPGSAAVLETDGRAARQRQADTTVQPAVMVAGPPQGSRPGSRSTPTSCGSQAGCRDDNCEL